MFVLLESLDEILIEESIVVGYSFLGNLDTIAKGEFLFRGHLNVFGIYKAVSRYSKDQSIAEKFYNVSFSYCYLSRQMYFFAQLIFYFLKGE